ncbi:ATPase [Microbacterium mangrovi]|uniref:ATPase n=1 Tax=Microbacterium mangrovi TaxID=1348253 RepID=A0A0B2ADL1_9MICO|nr:FGGY-family carbohydrate kinase [Microbacterium mangrovi]KHK99897.1 ATPase [Microbacterium mangrovi]
MMAASAAAEAIAAGRAVLGIELGSTRIKACLIGDTPADILAVGAHEWENRLVDGRWTYALEDVWAGVQDAYARLAADVRARYGIPLQTLRAAGVSGMMHGYLAFDAAEELLVPFRTWRNTSTGAAAAELTELLRVNIPLRWSVAHLHQAVRDAEPHVADVAFVTTLAGYVHWRLTGRRVVGFGEASGMFPVDAGTRDYDAGMLERYDRVAAGRIPPLRTLLPASLPAGTPAGELTEAGALLLDPTGVLQPGIPFCPPEGDAGTGMVATNAVAPRTGNVSAGTSIFAMVVLEHPLAAVHEELDLVATPDGSPVAMVHCNNGGSELAVWAGLFTRFATASGAAADPDAVYDVLLREALAGDTDAGGLVAYNHLAGEPIAGLADGRPLLVRRPDSTFTLANLMRAQLFGAFGTLALGMRVLTDEGVRLDRMFAHGGMFRTTGVAQRLLAAALDAPVAVGTTASEGGAWGIAVLADYLSHAHMPLGEYLDGCVFAGADIVVADPDPPDVAGFAAYLDRYRAGLAVEAAAVAAFPSGR